MVIEKEYLGNTLNHDELITAIGKALKSGHEKVNLTDEKKYPDVYEKPSIYSTDPSLQQKVDACNPVILRWITWTIQKDIKETIGPKQIYKWCNYKNGKVTFDNQAIEKWVEKTCFKYKTIGVTRSFKMSQRQNCFRNRWGLRLAACLRYNAEAIDKRSEKDNGCK